jgi:GntR family transcriptional regulator
VAQSEALYRRIASDLREQIQTGALAPGSQLPTEQEIGERYGVSRNTARLALGILANEGVITSTPGRGTFVRQQALTRYHASWAESHDHGGSDRADAYRAEVSSQGHQPGYRDFDMRIVSADAELARRLRVETGTSLVSRSFVRTVDDEPSSLQDSYYAMDVAQECGLLTPHDIPQGTVRAMAEHGHVEIGYVDELSTRMPTPDEARLLRLGTGAPVLIYTRTTFTKDRPLRVTLTVFAGDRNQIIYELGDLSAYQSALAADQ